MFERYGMHELTTEKVNARGRFQEAGTSLEGSASLEFLLNRPISDFTRALPPEGTTVSFDAIRGRARVEFHLPALPTPEEPNDVITP